MRSKEFFRRSKVAKVAKKLFATFVLLKNFVYTTFDHEMKIYKHYLYFQSHEKLDFRSPDRSFDHLKNETFDLLKFDLMIIPQSNARLKGNHQTRRT
jgi:hypothetical protein